MLKIAVIGTRKPTLEGLTMLRDVVNPYLEAGAHVWTGGADGVDAFIMEVMNKELNVPERLHVKLPWYGYGEQYLYPKNKVEIFDRDEHKIWLDSVVKYHPYGSTLKWGARCLHARNYGIVDPVSVVVALPGEPGGSGGTAQGMAIARALGKELIDIAAML